MSNDVGSTKRDGTARKGLEELPTITYQVANMTVEVPLLGPKVEKAREALNAIARQVYTETGSLGDDRLREAEAAFEALVNEEMREQDKNNQSE